MKEEDRFGRNPYPDLPISSNRSFIVVVLPPLLTKATIRPDPSTHDCGVEHAQQASTVVNVGDRRGKSGLEPGERGRGIHTPGCVCLILFGFRVQMQQLFSHLPTLSQNSLNGPAGTRAPNRRLWSLEARRALRTRGFRGTSPARAMPDPGERPRHVDERAAPVQSC